MRHSILFAALLTLMAGGARAADGDIVPGTLPAHGGYVAEAWLVMPTTRYDHLVRGNAAEAGGLRARLRTGETLTLALDTDMVFEDSRVRPADLDGDGHEEIVVVLTSLREGASLAVYGVDPGGIELRARTAFIGQPHRWLNPAGIADFDGDGRPEIALVQMPHLVKRLELWRLDGTRLVRVAVVNDVTNHRLGSTHTGMAAVGDFDGDGIADLAVPSGDRTRLRLIGFAGGTAHLIRDIRLPSPADGDIGVAEASGGWRLSVPLQSGKTATIDE